MAIYTFDCANKHILIPDGTTEVQLQSVYDDAMEWIATPHGMIHEPPLEAVGKIQLSPQVYTDIIFILSNQWKLKLPSGNYQLAVIGTCVTDDNTVRTVQPDTGSAEVTFEIGTSSTIVAPTITAGELDQVATEVWNDANAVSLLDKVTKTFKTLWNRKVLIKNTDTQLTETLYDDDDTTPIKTTVYTKSGDTEERD